MKLSTMLRLGRVSNLPTVWSNALAGAALAASDSPDISLVLRSAFVAVIVLLSLFYLGGMWLNDAFDAEIDTQQRSNRPIPQGETSRRAVFLGGGLMVAAATTIAFLLSTTTGLTAIALGVAVLLYDWLHKQTMLSPLLMGTTRFFCYLLSGVAIYGAMGEAVFLGAVGLFAFVVGLTYAAKQEAFDRLDNAWPLLVLALPLVLVALRAGKQPMAWLLVAALAIVLLLALRLLFRRDRGDVPRAVVTLIAGISLYDASLIAGTGAIALAWVAVTCFLVTLAMQRLVPGT